MNNTIKINLERGPTRTEDECSSYYYVTKIVGCVVAFAGAKAIRPGNSITEADAEKLAADKQYQVTVTERK